MERDKLPSVLIDAQVWATISAEVSYWSQRGQRTIGSPLEAVFYPLAAVNLRTECVRTPFDPIELRDIDHFTIGGVYLPPREFADYTSCSAKFRAHACIGNEQTMEQIFNEGVAAINRRYPQLLFLGPGHSHPFAVARTSPSTIDINHHILPYHRKNAELLGYFFSLALIVVQDTTRRGWQVCAFATDSEQRVRELGIARVVASDHIAIKHARATPYYRTRRGKVWELLQKAQLRDQLIEHERWPGGWTSFLIKRDAETATLVMIPPRFPRQSPLQQTISLATKQAGEVNCWQVSGSYRRYSLGGHPYVYSHNQYPAA
ncbi:MAG: hypothetical protein AB1489_11620 [Acidobacteriota bacterium]